MRLINALRLDPDQQLTRPPRLALVGSGGKTTALFRLASELAGSGRWPGALVTATTHLGSHQLALADRQRLISHSQQMEDFARECAELGGLPAGVTLLTGPAQGERVAGLSGELLDAAWALAEKYAAPLLVEADGSRRLPLKAPADHEPPIPAWVDQVVVAAGLSGLGAPLSEATVFRPERFADLSGLAPGDPVTPQALAQVLLHPQGGLKNIPTGARRVALLNQADRPNQQAAALQIAGQLIPTYAAVLTGRLENGGPLEVLAAHERVGGVLLAAGGSHRLGRPKQLLDWHGEPFVRRVARTALEAGLDPLVVVTGASAAQVEGALHDLPCVIVHNPEWQAGQSSSLRAGLARLPVEVGAAIFLLCDQPQVSPPLLRSLVEQHAQSLAPVIGPLVDGRRANPVLFDRRTFDELSGLSGDTGGRALFASYTPTWLDWHDANLLLDVDTEQDYQRLLESGA